MWHWYHMTVIQRIFCTYILTVKERKGGHKVVISTKFKCKVYGCRSQPLVLGNRLYNIRSHLERKHRTLNIDTSFNEAVGIPSRRNDNRYWETWIHPVSVVSMPPIQQIKNICHKCAEWVSLNWLPFNFVHHIRFKNLVEDTGPATILFQKLLSLTNWPKWKTMFLRDTNRSFRKRLCFPQQPKCGLPPRTGIHLPHSQLATLMRTGWIIIREQLHVYKAISDTLVLSLQNLFSKWWESTRSNIKLSSWLQMG